MPLSRDAAIDEMVTVITPALAGIPVQWPNSKEPDRSGVWGRVTFRHGESGRVTIGVRRERHVGFVFVQFFFPVGSGGTLLYSAPQPLLDALTDCKTPGGVWFRNVSLYENGIGSELDAETDTAYFSVMVQAQFEYDEIRT